MVVALECPGVSLPSSICCARGWVGSTIVIIHQALRIKDCVSHLGSLFYVQQLVANFVCLPSGAGQVAYSGFVGPWLETRLMKER